VRLDGLQGKREMLKNALVQRFESEVGKIEQKLRAHAATLTPRKPPSAGEKAEKPPTPASEQPPVAKTLFEPFDRMELSMRRDLFRESDEFLSVLRSSSENPENEKTLAQAVAELSRLGSLLPVTLEVSESRKPPERADAEDKQPPAPKVNAERVAEQLNEIRRLIRVATLTKWSVDRALDEARAANEGERKRCVEADRALKRLWLSVAYQCVVLLLASISVSFLSLVLADLTKALLDSANNSAVVASVYENASPVPEEET
jgi:hypothetical protein